MTIEQIDELLKEIGPPTITDQRRRAGAARSYKGERP